MLWLFTDAARLPDPCAAAARLPAGLCGVVLRDDGQAGRAALARQLAAICRGRRNRLVVAGDWRLALRLGAGLHLRAGRRKLRHPSLVTSSAHGVAELRRAARAGARLAFLSPAFATASHPGAPGLGPARWGALVRAATPGPGNRIAVAALGGLDGRLIRRLPAGLCRAAGAIGALG